MDEIRAILFDASNTLLYVRYRGDKPWSSHPLMTLGRPFARFDQWLERVYAHARRKGEEAHPLSRVYRRILDALRLPENYGPFAPFLRSDKHYRARVGVFDDTWMTLERLHGRYSLGVVSNAWPGMMRLLEALNLARYFEHIIISTLVGWAKPEPGIYEVALQRMGVPAAAAVFVDDVVENVRAALALGMRAYLIDRRDRHPQVDVPRIRSLTELLTELGLEPAPPPAKAEALS
ncbi:MAG: HAD family hydrolase [Chloroflexi bacterium]|nr:HAD family hydrolase [Chloroflexota bacterium]